MINDPAMEDKKEFKSQATIEIIDNGPIKITGRILIRDSKRDITENPEEVYLFFQDPETGELRVVDVSDAGTRRRLRPASFEEADRVFRRTRVDCVRLSTAESYERPLTSFFRAREKRR